MPGGILSMFSGRSYGQNASGSYAAIPVLFSWKTMHQLIMLSTLHESGKRKELARWIGHPTHRISTQSSISGLSLSDGYFADGEVKGSLQCAL